MRVWLAFLLLSFFAACGATGPQKASEKDIAALAASLQAMSSSVDPAEAQRAARLSYDATFQLAQSYGITDPPLIHNAKVNAGTRPRGLCYHWAEDLQARLDAEGFTTLQTARAIANADSAILIDHSTTVLTPRGAAMQDGVVVDPWRYGGRLFWSPVTEDKRYVWQPRLEVLRKYGRITYVHRTDGSLAAPPADE